MHIGLIVAMTTELEQLLQVLEVNTTTEVNHLKFFECTKDNGTEIVLAKSGIGKVNAAIGTLELINRYHPDAIISTGVAGGIDQSLDVMDIVASSKLIYHDVDCGEGNEPGQVQDMPVYYDGDRTILDKIQGCYAECHIHEGLICTGDQFISDKDALAKIKAIQPDALAVDMESCAIAQTCFLYKVPFVSLRIISDIPGKEDHIATYNNFWQTMAEKSFAATKRILQLL